MRGLNMQGTLKKPDIFTRDRHVQPRVNQTAQGIADQQAARNIARSQLVLLRLSVGQQLGAQHAWEDGTGDRRGEQYVAAPDEDIGEAALGQKSVDVDEYRLIGLAAGAGCIIRPSVAGLVTQLDVVAEGGERRQLDCDGFLRSRRQRRVLHGDRAVSR